MPRCPELFRQIQIIGVTKGFSGTETKVNFQNPGEMVVVEFHGRYYEKKEDGKLYPLDNKHGAELIRRKYAKTE